MVFSFVACADESSSPENSDVNIISESPSDDSNDGEIISDTGEETENITTPQPEQNTEFEEEQNDPDFSESETEINNEDPESEDSNTAPDNSEEQEQPTNPTANSLSDKQKSSISMLNYITVLSKEINASSNSKLLLDNIYSDIVNNIYPNAIDNDSMSEIRVMLNTIHAYQSIETKRERLQYIYEQNQANAIKSAIPNPLSILSVVQSGDPVRALVSVVYMAVDSAASYSAYMNEAEQKFIQDGWTLDDEAADNLHESRLEAFTYMVEMCQKMGLPGELALNEKSVDEFVSWENQTNVTRRIEFLEKNEATYQAYGKYWLVLANSYFEKGDYEKCLEAIETYEDLGVNTFRYDRDLAKALSVALVAANEIYDDDQYVTVAEHYLSLLLSNIENDDWLLRYVAAQTYMGLYSKTNDMAYLEKAYDLVLTNVNYLVDVQYKKNEEYLNDLVLLDKKGLKGDKKKEVENYNSMLKAERQIALPPVYQPLVINCELLFGLAKKLNISEAEKTKINEIIHYKGRPLFLIEPLDNLYRFTPSNSDVKVTFDGKQIEIPVVFLEQGSSVKLTIQRGSDIAVYDNWTLNKVERNDKNSIDTFFALYTNKPIKKEGYTEGDKIIINIIPPEDSNYDTQEFIFVAAKEDKWIGYSIVFNQVG